MQIDVIPCVNEVISDDFINKTTIVIDVLRATSTIVTALEHGSSGVIPVETVNQAKNLQEQHDLLGGERFSKKITGFHFGNSPLEYTRKEVQGKRIIITTTNGTRAIQKSHKAMHVLAGCLLNAAACATTAAALKRDIIIVCAGTQNVFSLEDGLCAGLIIEELINLDRESIELSDFAIAMHCTYKDQSCHLEETMLQCSQGVRLCKLGFKDDVIYCSQINLLSVVPILREQMMQAYSSK